MGFKYKKSSLRKLLSMSPKQRTQLPDSNYLPTNNVSLRRHMFTDHAKLTTTRKSFMCLIIGLIAGLGCGQLFSFSYSNIPSLSQNNEISQDHGPSFNRLPSASKIEFGSHVHNDEDTTLAVELSKEVRVLCWVMTNPNSIQSTGQAIKKTWGSRCNKLIFMSSVEDTELGAVALPVPDGDEHSWGKMKEAFKYIYEHHLDEYDWFMKADDDTYVIVENVRKMLYAYSTEFPIYLGCKFKPIVKQGYMAGGAGFVLSKEAIKRFVERALPDATKCRKEDDGGEETELGQCLESVGVLAGDSRDEYERGRMFPFAPDHHLLADPSLTDYWYWKYIFYKSDEGLDCCSDHAISFHYIKPDDMYVYDYLIYHLRPFGITPGEDILPDKKSLDQIINELSIPSNNNSTLK